MHISQLWVYPVKSLRGISIDEAQATRIGLEYDRTFMLVKCEAQDELPHRNMHLPDHPMMMLFTTELQLPTHADDRGSMTITYNDLTKEKTLSISTTLRPDVEALDLIDIKMHGSTCQAYRVGKKYDDWFSKCFGFDVNFVYLGHSRRRVLMSTSNDAPRTSAGPIAKPSSWLSTLSSYTGLGSNQSDEERITFADCAPYLVCSDASCQEVTTRLDGEEMQIVKFRPNIVVAGADAPWAEDYWGEIAIVPLPSPSDPDPDENEDAVHISLPQNCGRCASINIDYSTGKPSTTSSGQVLKRLQKDRRVDVGMKYSPIFGRYGFASKNAGRTIRVGDAVSVVKKNAEHTKFDWPDLATKFD